MPAISIFTSLELFSNTRIQGYLTLRPKWMGLGKKVMEKK